MRTVKTFWNIAEAGFAHSLLEAAGLHPFLANEHVGGLGLNYLGADMRLQVAEAEYAQALRVLSEGPGEDLPSERNPANS